MNSLQTLHCFKELISSNNFFNCQTYLIVKFILMHKFDVKTFIFWYTQFFTWLAIFSGVVLCRCSNYRDVLQRMHLLYLSVIFSEMNKNTFLYHDIFKLWFCDKHFSYKKCVQQTGLNQSFFTKSYRLVGSTKSGKGFEWLIVLLLWKSI